VNQPTVSHHLNMLADAKLVQVRKEGRRRFYTLNQERVAMCCGMLVDRFAPEHSLKAE
jgi:DNA-binding transcriptional ArsR family regulator